ncbi:MAG: transporter substrate-binding domain-containing protein [Desulfobacterales bacterium]
MKKQTYFAWKTLLLSLAAVLAVSLSAFGETVRVAYFITSPHVIIDTGTGKPGGACVELFEKIIAPEMGVTVQWESAASSIPRQLDQLEKGQVDAGLVFAKNEERMKILNYPQHPYFVSHPTLAFLKSHPIEKISKVEDILGLSIGYGTKAYVSPFMRDERIRFDLVTTPNWMDLNLKKLLSGRNDAMYQPERSSFLYYMRKQKLEDRIKLISLPETAELYTTFSKKARADLAERYDRAFEKVGGTARYIEILSKYLDTDKL